MSKEPLLRFTEPDDVEVAKHLAALVDKIEPSGIISAFRIGKLTRRPDYRADTSAEMVRYLIDLLRADWRKNSFASGNEPWSFDYEVRRDERDSKVLQILTRLFHPEKPGNIFYGRYVQRKKSGSLLAWVDD